MMEKVESTDDVPDGWLPAKVLGCFECGVYVDPADDANYCRECGEELWELTKA